MPRKPGIFKRFQPEILQLHIDGVGYTEIAAILNEKYGVKVTKQNLEQSHKRYIKEQLNSAPKGTQNSGTNKHQSRRNRAGVKPAIKRPDKASKGVKGVAQTLEFRELIKRVQLELVALLDAEEASGRFSPSEMSLLRGWSRVLLSQHPDTAGNTYRDCYGGDFSTYQAAVQDAFERIQKEQLYRANEDNVMLTDEEEFLRRLSLKMESEEAAEKQSSIQELREYLEANPRLKGKFNFDS